MDQTKRLAAFSRLGSNWLWETDVHDRFSFFSTARTGSGVELEGRIGRHRRDGADPDPDNLVHFAALEATIARREPFRDFVYRAGSGSEPPHWCSVTGEPRHDSQGAFAGYRGIASDVTETVEAQKALETKSAALDAILAAMPDGVQLIGRDGARVVDNNQFYDILGIPNRSHQDWTVSGGYQSLLDLAARGEFGPGDPATLARQSAEGMVEASMSNLPMSRRRLLKTGQWIETRLRRLENGTLLVLTRDITEDKRRETELERQAALLSTIVTNIDGAIAVYDKDRRLALWNARFPVLLGIDPSLLKVGVSALDLLISQARSGEFGPCRDPESEGARRFATFFGDQPIDVERTRPDGTVIHMRRNLVPGGGAVTLYMDVTELRRTATELRELNATLEQRVVEGTEQLRAAQRVEAIGQLTGGLAHDLNNYLGVIMGNLDLLTEQAGVDSNVQALIANAIAGAERGAALTKSLLAFSRRQPLAPRILDIGPRIREITGLIERTIGDRIVLVVGVAPNLWPVEIDAAQLDAAIVNLAVNARDAMPNGGKLTIDVRNESRGAIAHGATHPPPGDNVLIEVTDTGCGMTAETLARAFEPFYSTKGAAHGTGLGLSMVHGFVHQSGGTILLDSALGKGTTVSLRLPRSHHLPTEEIAGDRPASAPGGERILLVDDNADVRSTVRRQMESLGYRVTEADSGDAALVTLETDASAFDLVTTDVVMPGKIDGLDLARLVRQRWPALGLLLTSGFSGEFDSSDNSESNDAATFHMLRKPYRKAELAITLQRVLSAGVSVRSRRGT